MHLLLHVLGHLGLHAGGHFARGGALGEAILLPWEIWLIVWFLAALFTQRTALARPPVAAETAAQRGGYVALAVAAFVLVFWARPPWHWGPLAARLYPRLPGWYALGAVLAWGGILFTFWARAHLGTRWNGRVTVRQDHRLVHTGPYRWVRHPIYSGMLAAYLGACIALGEVRAVLGLAVVMAMFTIKIRREETLLAPYLGTGYAAYRRRTPALFPGIGGGRRRRAPNAEPGAE